MERERGTIPLLCRCCAAAVPPRHDVAALARNSGARARPLRALAPRPAGRIRAGRGRTGVGLEVEGVVAGSVDPAPARGQRFEVKGSGLGRAGWGH